MARSIAIVSLAQGNGKTTVALNLAIALHALNHRVLVLDGDFTKDNLIEHLELHDLPCGLDQVLNDEVHIHDAVYKHLSGIRLLPSKVHNYDNLSYHYQDLLADYDYIIIDTPSQLQYLETVLKNADEALIVHGPNYSSRTVMEAAELLKKLKVLNLGVILNRFSEKSKDELLGLPVLEKIPFSKDIEKSYKLKNPLLHTKPKSKESKNFHRLAERLV